ncbi:MAG: neutral/alkaline non-lysosomal ceramidase N-terminal domain-containing protein [Moraxellaceae bacterium]
MYQAGWSKQDLDIPARGYAMHGFGMWHHRARGQRTPLYARALYLRDETGGELFFCCYDMGYVTHAMREGVLLRLRAALGADFDEARLVLTCTHTHSGPGGCTHDVLYNVVTPGFRPDHLEKVVSAGAAALLAARASAADTELALSVDAIAPEVEVAWNRSLAAYNRNPDVERRAPTETHLALDRRMSVLGLRRQGRLCALLSLFGVHATCLGNSLQLHDGDNKGYAAAHAEKVLAEAGAEGAVAIFAQATAGDVSPHYHGPGDKARRRALRGEAEYAYAMTNGQRQAEFALGLLAGQAATPVSGAIDAIFGYADFSAQQADPEYAGGHAAAFTSEPCHGVSFFTGTPIDGPGMPGLLGQGARLLARRVKAGRLKNIEKLPAPEQARLLRLYAAQGPKDVLLEAGSKRILGRPLDRLPLPGFADPLVGELKRQVARGAVRDSALVPTVLPLQIVRLGTLALVCAPGEFTTTAGRRLCATVGAQLAGQGVAQVLICTYCNDYMGYVTTYEEYQQQAYEGGHTVFGQWTLAAFQTRFAALARELATPPAARGHDRTTRPLPPPADELARRSNLPVP